MSLGTAEAHLAFLVAVPGRQEPHLIIHLASLWIFERLIGLSHFLELFLRSCVSL